MDSSATCLMTDDHVNRLGYKRNGLDTFLSNRFLDSLPGAFTKV
jgi:hypothetical protein